MQISGVGTIIPEVKICESFNVPQCNKEEGNPPYTRIRMSRNNILGEKINQTLLENIKNGIYGLEKIPFAKQQMTYLRNGGFILKADGKSAKKVRTTAVEEICTRLNC